MNRRIIKLKSPKRLIYYSQPLLFLILLGIVFFGVQQATAGHISEAEIEQYVRARIALGESMRDFFRNRRPPQFGPDGEGPDMERLRRLEEEINAHVAKVLARHDLTIEEYQDRSPDVFSDEEAVNRFLEEHPDLKERYEALPPSPRRRGRR
ncbi:MAG: hypothetical protein ACE5J1_06330 [Nitrospiria bacterium]